MKLKALASIIIAAALTGCADLGFGVDVDSGGVSPYIYGNGPYYDGPWGGLGWSYDFPMPPARPLPPPYYGGPGPVIPSRPQVRPPMNPPASGNGMTNSVPTIGLGGNQRPGNGGLPTATPTQGVKTESLNNFINNNARRGR